MPHCQTCKRNLATVRSAIEIAGQHYCSEACRKKHLGKTPAESRVARREVKLAAFRKSLPFFILGTVLLITPLAGMVFLTLYVGYVGLYDWIGGIVYLLPGMLVFHVGVRTYRQRAGAKRRL